MQETAIMTLRDVGPETFEPLVGQKIWLEGAAGLAIEVEVLEVSRGRMLPGGDPTLRRQGFSVLFEYGTATPDNICGTFAVRIEGFPQEPVFIARIAPPINRAAHGVYLEACFS